MKFGLIEQNQRLTFNTVLIGSTSFWNQTTENFVDFGTLVCVLANSSRWSAPAAGLQLLTGHRDPRGPLRDMVCHSDPLFRRAAQQESHEDAHFLLQMSLLRCHAWSVAVDATTELRQGKFLQARVRLAFVCPSESAVDTGTVPRATSLFQHQRLAAPSLQSVLWSFFNTLPSRSIHHRGSCEEIKRRLGAKSALLMK